MEQIISALTTGFTTMMNDILSGLATTAPIVVPILGATVGIFVIVRFVKKFLGR